VLKLSTATLTGIVGVVPMIDREVPLPVLTPDGVYSAVDLILEGSGEKGRLILFSHPVV
jgi:hypothetical protein